MKTKNYFHRPVDPFRVDKEASVSDILERMGRISFQGRNLAVSFQIWQEMFKEPTTIFLGLAGAMVPAGMRRIVTYLIENRLIDCLVSTGANLFHDIHETLGRFHWMGHPVVDDSELKDLGIDRIYDTFALEEEFKKADRFIIDFALTLDLQKSYTTREFLMRLGEKLQQMGKEEGILTTAARLGVPIYCPAIGDSSIGIALAVMAEKNQKLLLDPIEDVRETARLVIQAQNTGVIYVGGGTPKNFIQQTEVTAPLYGEDVSGHRYAIQFTTDSAHWGGLSGCTFEEAQSWGKIEARAQTVSVHMDATIALPIVVSALAQRSAGWQKRQCPIISFQS